MNPDLVVRDQDGKVMTVRYEAVNAMLLNEFPIPAGQLGTVSSSQQFKDQIEPMDSRRNLASECKRKTQLASHQVRRKGMAPTLDFEKIAKPLSDAI